MIDRKTILLSFPIQVDYVCVPQGNKDNNCYCQVIYDFILCFHPEMFVELFFPLNVIYFQVV